MGNRATEKKKDLGDMELSVLRTICCWEERRVVVLLLGGERIATTTIAATAANSSIDGKMMDVNVCVDVCVDVTYYVLYLSRLRNPGRY